MRAAAAKLGAAIEVLDFEDCRVADTPESRMKAAAVIRQHRPRLLFAPYHTNPASHHDGLSHPDHLATGALVRAAARFAKFAGLAGLAGEPWDAAHLLYYMVPRTMRPTFYHDVTDCMDEWETIARCHESQMQLRGGTIMERLRALPAGLRCGHGRGVRGGILDRGPPPLRPRLVPEEVTMENFVFQNATRIVFGRGTEEAVGRETAAVAKRVLLHYGGKSVKASGLLDRVRTRLREAGVAFEELGGVVPNPRLSLVREGIALCRKQRLEAVLAVGGGSVIDSAKAIAMGVPYAGDVWDFYTGKASPKAALPVGAVLTIPAAGSESSDSTVITNEDGWYKKATGAEILRPRFAVMDPVLTMSLPPYQTACGAADIMAHVMERYFTRVKAVDFTDRLCEATLRTIVRNVPIALAKSDDYDARAEIMWAGTVAHNDLLGTGRVGDWATHMIEHEVSGIYDVAHGAGLAVLFPAWMTYVMPHDVERFAQFATRVFDVEHDYASSERTAREGIRRLRAFWRSIGLPGTLSEMNVGADRLDEMAGKATEGGTLGSFAKLARADVRAILDLAR